jgi:hypothetical protein
MTQSEPPASPEPAFQLKYTYGDYDEDDRKNPFGEGSISNPYAGAGGTKWLPGEPPPDLDQDNRIYETWQERSQSALPSYQPSGTYAGDWYPTAPPAEQSHERPRLNTGGWTEPDTDADGPDNYLYGLRVARAWRRVSAGAIDMVATVVLPLLIVLAVTGDNQNAALTGVFWSVLMLVLINSFLLPVSLGKRLLGIQVVRPVAYNGGRTLARVGVGRTFLRLVMHFPELGLYLFIVPFLNRRYQRMISDSLTHVIHLHPEGGVDTRSLPRAPSGAVDIA